jgi:hypothetical protein
VNGFWNALIDVLKQSLAASDVDEIAQIRATTITAGEVRQALAALKAVDVAALERVIVERLVNIADDELVANSVLSALAMIGVPGAGMLLAIVKFAEVVIPYVAANQAAHPIVNPVRDAQTTEGRGGRRG